MKKIIIALMLVWVAIWQPATEMKGQKIKESTPAKSILDIKQKEKLEMFYRVELSQDSILRLLKNQPKRTLKPQAIRYVKVYKIINLPVDTLMVKDNIIVNPPDTLPNDYYLIRDTSAPKKLTFFQKIFRKKLK